MKRALPQSTGSESCRVEVVYFIEDWKMDWSSEIGSQLTRKGVESVDR